MAKGRLRFYTERCKGCELCIKFCPHKILGLDKSAVNVMGYNPVGLLEPEKCNGCAICALMCPDMVIEVERE